METCLVKFHRHEVRVSFLKKIVIRSQLMASFKRFPSNKSVRLRFTFCFILEFLKSLKIKRIIITKLTPIRSMVYVQFETEDDVNSAMKLNRQSPGHKAAFSWSAIKPNNSLFTYFILCFQENEFRSKAQ